MISKIIHSYKLIKNSKVYHRIKEGRNNASAK